MPKATPSPVECVEEKDLVIRGVPASLIRSMRIEAAIQGVTTKQLLITILEGRYPDHLATIAAKKVWP